MSKKRIQKPAGRLSSSTQPARAYLERLRGELREREADANALAERIGALQQRIDTAVSKLEDGQDVKRRKETRKRVPKK